MKPIKARCYEFSVRVVRLCRALEKRPGTVRSLANQLFRSATSIAANVAEANARESRRDFIHKISVATKEAHETQYWLNLLVDAEYLAPEKLKSLRNECDQLVAILVTTLKTARTNS